MQKIYYSIGEVAELLHENVSLVRFWSVRPERNAKGNRIYTADDVKVFRQIHFLVRDCGYSLEGAYKKLLSERGKLEKSVEMLGLLRSLRSELEDARNHIAAGGPFRHNPDNSD